MSTQRMSSVLVMAKTPHAGTVKTRLHPLLSPRAGSVASPGVRLMVQRGGTLGQRLTSAAVEAFADGAGPLLVIGTDAPTLTGDHLTAAFAALERHDAVLGPALNGGYYLIGMRSPHSRLFGLDAAVWSTDQVLADTRALAAERGLSAELLCPLRDLDTPEDAAALLADPLMPTRIAALLRPPVETV